MYRTELPALAYHPCLLVDQTGTVSAHLLVNICEPAVPLGVKVIYALLPVAMTVHVLACGVSFDAKEKNPEAISTLLPAMIVGELALFGLSIEVRLNPSSELIIVTDVDI